MFLKSVARSLFPQFLDRRAVHRSLWRAYNTDGEWELRELQHLVKPGSAAIDIGGNIGEYAYHLSRYAAVVHVFEPNPDYVARITALRRPQIRIESVALSSAPGEAELRIPIGEGGGSASLESSAVSDAETARKLSVPLRTLDSYGFDNVSFIKIDVEGHEESVLAGAWDTIRRNQPALLIEIEERHNIGGLDRIVAALAEHGYQAWFFRNGQRRPLAEFDAARDQQVDKLADLDSSTRRSLDYINNFLFLKA